MGKSRGLHVIMLLLAFIAPTSLRAEEESVLSRFNPFRNFRSPASGTSMTDGQREALRSQLEARGVDQRHIEQRLGQITAQEENLRPDGHGIDGRQFSLDVIRSHMVARGIDPAVIDERMAQLIAARANGQLQSQARDRLGRGTFNGDAPTHEQLRARMEQRGFSAAEIDARIARLDVPRGDHPHTSNASENLPSSGSANEPSDNGAIRDRLERFQRGHEGRVREARR